MEEEHLSYADTSKWKYRADMATSAGTSSISLSITTLYDPMGATKPIFSNESISFTLNPRYSPYLFPSYTVGQEIISGNSTEILIKETFNISADTPILNLTNPETLALECGFFGGTYRTFRNYSYGPITLGPGNGLYCTNYNLYTPINFVMNEIEVKFIGVDPAPSVSPSPSPTPTTPLALRVTFIKDNDADPEVNGNSTTAIIAPSFDSCGELPSRTALRSFKVECINPNSGAVVSGCQLTADLALGTQHGGHEHDFDSRPLGVIYPQLASFELIPIPIAGAEMSYESSEVSGDVDVALTGIGPDGRNLSPAYVRFNVKTEGFGPLANDGLYFAVESHSTGDKGTTRLKDKLLELVTTFDDIVSEIITTPKLQSQGASLPLGGLLDIEKNWSPPHCEHRNGDILDISFSSFKNFDPSTQAFLHSALESSFKKVGFKYPIHKNNHWHAKLK